MTEKKEALKEKKEDERNWSKKRCISRNIRKNWKMTVLELAELVKALEEKFGVSAAIPMAPAAGVAGNGAEAEKEEEKTSFNVILKEIGANKIKVIKEIRTITALGLKESKDLVEGAPNTVKENVDKKEAEEIKAKLEAVGAVAEIK